MFALKTTRPVAAIVRGRSVYHLKPFNTSSPKFEVNNSMTGSDASQKIPSEGSIARHVIKLEQDLMLNKLRIDHQAERFDEGIKDVKGALRDGFKRTDHWFMFFAGALLLKGSIDTVNSGGMSGKKSKEN